MAPARQHPPAWYPDPVAPSHQLRRWDGVSWTDDVRPLPDVLRTLRLSPGPVPRHQPVLGALRPAYRPQRAQNPARRLWVASALCLVVALVMIGPIGGFTTVGRSASRVADEAFLADASKACSSIDDAAVRPTDDDPVAHHALVDAHEELVRELRRIPVASGDQPAVDAWLASWDSWTTTGRRYAQALDAGDKDAAKEASEASQQPMARVRAFAYVNDIPDCVILRRR